MRKIKMSMMSLAILAVTWSSCSNDDDLTADIGETLTELPAAFAVFDTDNTTIMLVGDAVSIETNGLPNHTSPYWSTSLNAQLSLFNNIRFCTGTKASKT